MSGRWGGSPLSWSGIVWRLLNEINCTVILSVCCKQINIYLLNYTCPNRKWKNPPKYWKSQSFKLMNHLVIRNFRNLDRQRQLLLHFFLFSWFKMDFFNNQSFLYLLSQFRLSRETDGIIVGMINVRRTFLFFVLMIY